MPGRPRDDSYTKALGIVGNMCPRWLQAQLWSCTPGRLCCHVLLRGVLCWLCTSGSHSPLHGRGVVKTRDLRDVCHPSFPVSSSQCCLELCGAHLLQRRTHELHIWVVGDGPCAWVKLPGVLHHIRQDVTFDLLHTVWVRVPI